MVCFEVIIFKNRIKRPFYVKDVVNSNEKEGTTNEISLSLDLIKVKDGNNFYIGVSKPCLFVLVCPCLFILYWNFKLYCFYFFQNLRFQIRGATYLRMRLIHRRLWYFYVFVVKKDTQN